MAYSRFEFPEELSRINCDREYYLRLLELGIQGTPLDGILKDPVIASRGYSRKDNEEAGQWILDVYRSNRLPSDVFPQFWSSAMAYIAMPDNEEYENPEAAAKEREDLKQRLLKAYQH